MADIALDALQVGMLQPTSGTRNSLPISLAEGPAAADVWIENNLGLALLVHRRSDGLVSEELYHSVLNSNGNWLQCEHLGGAILGFDIEVPAAIEDVLAGAPMAVLSESESLIYTGRNDAEEEGYESTRAVTVPVGSKVDLIEIEDLSQVITARSGRFTTDVKSPLMLLVLRPGQKLRVSALRHEGSSLVRIGSAMKLFFAER